MDCKFCLPGNRQGQFRWWLVGLLLLYRRWTLHGLKFWLNKHKWCLLLLKVLSLIRGYIRLPRLLLLSGCRVGCCVGIG